MHSVDLAAGNPPSLPALIRRPLTAHSLIQCCLTTIRYARAVASYPATTLRLASLDALLRSVRSIDIDCRDLRSTHLCVHAEDVFVCDWAAVAVGGVDGVV
jgi:hypothetical protein